MAVTEQILLSPDALMAQAFRRADAFLVTPGTPEELYRAGEVKADFIEDFIYLHMAASIPHERIFINLLTDINVFVRTRQAGLVFGSRTPVDFGPDYHPMPDILYLSKDNPARVESNRIVGVPDLVVEIISASTRKMDLGDKRRLYRQYGVPEIYFIDLPGKQVIVDQLKEGNYETFTAQTGSFESRVLPGLARDVAQLFNV